MFKKIELLKFIFLLIFWIVTFDNIPKAYSQSKKSINTYSYQNSKENEAEASENLINPLNLMHKTNFQRSRNNGEFIEDTMSDLSEATKSFRENQIKAIKQQELKKQI